MSAYEMNRLMYDLREPESRSALLADLDAYMDRYNLTPEERQMLANHDWQALVDTELDAAGRPDAELVMELTTSTTEQTRLTIGSEDGAWFQTWWSGPMEEGNKVPSSLTID